MCRDAPLERSSIIHGDSKLDDIILEPTELWIVAILPTGS
jgi:aminoglycoside phosphotransferase (APT) family kinase protein